MSSDAPKPVQPYVADPGSEDVMRQFQQLMSQFLQTQALVMTAYLQGTPGAVAPSPLAMTPPAPSAAARALPAQAPLAPPIVSAPMPAVVTVLPQSAASGGNRGTACGSCSASQGRASTGRCARRVSGGAPRSDVDATSGSCRRADATAHHRQRSHGVSAGHAGCRCQYRGRSRHRFDQADGGPHGVSADARGLPARRVPGTRWRSSPRSRRCATRPRCSPSCSPRSLKRLSLTTPIGSRLVGRCASGFPGGHVAVSRGAGRRGQCLCKQENARGGRPSSRAFSCRQP